MNKVRYFATRIVRVKTFGDETSFLAPGWMLYQNRLLAQCIT